MILAKHLFLELVALNNEHSKTGKLIFEGELFVRILNKMSIPNPHPEASLLALPVIELHGVGPERAAQLARLDVSTINDLFLLRPRRYEDRRQVQNIASTTMEEPSTVRGTIVALGIKRFNQGRKSLFEIILDDGSARLHCRWWNLPYMQQYFQQGDEVLVYGKLNSLRPRTIDHPETEVIEGGEESSIHLNRIAPIYPLTEGLPQRWIRSLVWRTLQAYGSKIAEPWSPEGYDESFLMRKDAISELHFPSEWSNIEKARQRLALDEFTDLQLTIQSRKKKLQTKAQHLCCTGDNSLIKPFLAQLSFSLTEAQTKVLRELREDMAGPEPMRRLLQGDVGSGKTVVAACCGLMTIESGFNVVLMAPTEILAEQHFRTLSRWLKPLDIEVDLYTGSRKTFKSNSGEHSGILELIPATKPRGLVVVGTHALIEEAFAIENLGLVIIDEQHKFGVQQREKLLRKGAFPHLLAMTATPIPRTLGLTIYGDLDISTIDQLPAGRIPIKTYVRTSDALPKVWEFIRGQITTGRQAYVVYPRIEDDGKGGLKAVLKEWENLKQELKPHQVGLLHGRMGSEEKDQVITSFRNNTIQVLLTTPLIEVGLDIPNANIMLVENAEQFGLAQLHQLRGRIGRGTYQSYCILVANKRSEEIQQRLHVLEQSNDGFRIAEADLRLRGPGDFLGHDQSGMPPLIFADLTTDLPLAQKARTIATDLLNA